MTKYIRRETFRKCRQEAKLGEFIKGNKGNCFTAEGKIQGEIIDGLGETVREI